MKKADIGLWGLAVMGENLVLNMESRGFTVAVFNRTVSKVDDFTNGRAKGKNIIGCKSVEEFIGALEKPRKVMIMVKAGKPVDLVIDQVMPLLEKGDTVIDGGNSHSLDTIRRCRDIESKGLLYIGTGVSGGEEGALKGPSLMPGGTKKAYDLIEKIFTKIAAQIDGRPCCTYIGQNGAGHYVKMIHNGIEYADMQLIAEAYLLMADALALTPDRMSDVFADWNKGDLDSYLIEITADILKKKDPETSKPMVDIILDTAGQKGTGAWTAQNALELGVSAPTIAEAVFARCISAVKDQRIAAAKHLSGPDEKFTADKTEFINAIRNALYASKICSYAQGFALMDAAAKKYQWDLNFGQIAMIWRGGCIIRARFLNRIKDAYDKNPDLQNLLLDPYFSQIVRDAQPHWRSVVSTAAQLGIPVPAFGSALNYFDSYRSPRLSANLLQAQRDYFGAHTYQRIDKDGSFHTNWLNI